MINHKLHNRPNSPMLYAETTTVSPDEQSQGCPRCGGAVFQAEAVSEKGLTYHKRCFTCVNCNRPQNDKLQVFVGFDKQLYCKTCYPKIWHTPLPIEASNRSKIKAEPGDESGCPKCGGKVFEVKIFSICLELGLLFYDSQYTLAQFDMYLNNYFNFHVCSVFPSVYPKLASIPAVISQNVTIKRPDR